MGSFRSAAERFYRRLVRVYPEDFRAEYGEEMTGLFRDRSREEPLLPLLIAVFFDTLKTAPKEHFSMWSQDLRYAGRTLLRNPGFALIAAGSLAIGIGANAAVFSLADALLLRPLSVARPAEIVSVRSSEGGPYGGVYANASYLDYVDLRDQNRSFAGLIAFTTMTATLGGEADALPRLTMGMLVSGNFFRVLGVDPEVGRGFRPDEDQAPGRNPVAILSHGSWAQAFGGARDVVGRTVWVNGISLTVVGVAPERFTGMDQYQRPEVYVPFAMAPTILGPRGGQMLRERNWRGLSVRGRLLPGVSLAQADVELSTLAKNLEQAHPETNRNQGLSARTEFQARVEASPPDAALTAMLMLLVALVLFIACANVASLLVSRAGARAREIAVRLAVGAGRARLLRQLLTESLLLALLGGVLGLGVAYAGVRFFSGIPIPTDLPIALTVQLDGRVLAFSLAASVASVFLFGLMPALGATRADLVASLKAGEAGVSRKGRFWGRRTLVAGQVALSLVLLAAATGLVRGVRLILRADPGFRREGLLLSSFDPTLERIPPAETRAFYRELLARARSLPGVTSAALANAIPLSNQQFRPNFQPEGFTPREGEPTPSSWGNVVDPAYFPTMGIALSKGRAFTEADDEGAPRVAIVNEELAHKYWPNQDPIGKRLRLDSAEGPWAEVVGVARTHKYLWVGESPAEFVYLPWAQSDQAKMTLILATRGEAGSLAGPLRELVHSVGPNVAMHDVYTMEDLFRMRAVNVPRMIVESVAAMGLLGLSLALVGLYGLMAYSVSRRTREIGIRMAIGADPRSVVRMVLRQGLQLTALGLAVGLVASLGVSRVLMAAFHGLAPVDPVALILLPLALLAVSAFAILAPAYRAARIEPTTALRQD